MLSYFIIFSIFILFYLLVFTVIKPKNYPPGPTWLPVIGCYKQFRDVYSRKRYFHLLWDYFQEVYGSVVGLKLGSNKIVLVSGYDAAKEVLSRKEFQGRPDGFFYRLRSFGERLGVVFVDGSSMQGQRNFCHQKLKLSGSGKATISDVVTTEALEVVNLITAEYEKGPIEVQLLFEVSTLNTIWSLLTGERFHLRDKKLVKLLNLVHNGFRLVDMTGGLLNQMPFLRFIAPSWSGYNSLTTIVFEITEFLQEVVTKFRENNSEDNFITTFLQEVANNKNNTNTTFTEKQLLVLLEDFFMAGSETTSSTLSFIFIYLIKYPHVQNEIHSELDQILGPDQLPTIEHRDKLVYLMATIMEVQRHANPVPLVIPHRAMEDTELMNYKIPKDTVVIPSLWSIHMDKNYWKDPFEFKPERFIDSEGKLRQNLTHFMPFGVGKRRCMGEMLAKTSLFLFLAMILRKFQIKSSTESFSVEILDGVGLSPAPFEVNFILRKSENVE